MKITDLIPGETILIRIDEYKHKVKVMAIGSTKICISKHDNYKELLSILELEEINILFEIYNDPLEYIQVREGFYDKLEIKVVKKGTDFSVYTSCIKCLVFTDKKTVFTFNYHGGYSEWDLEIVEIIASRAEIEKCKL